MGRTKNALRNHYVAPWTSDDTVPTESDFMELAHLISDIEDATDETTESEGFYDGDGTPELTVLNVAGAYDYSGFYDNEDPAQAFIAAMKYETGNGRRCWQRIVSSDGLTTWTGPATVSEIVAGSGPAVEDEAFSCTITFRRRPEITGTGVPATPQESPQYAQAKTKTK